MANKGRHTGMKSKSRANQLSAYKGENRELVNRRKKVAKHIKRFPGDEQAKTILNIIK